MGSIYQTIKEEAYEANMQIPARNLAIYTWGNVSAFDAAKGVFAIKPSGVPYPDLTVDSMVIVDLDGNTVEGTLNPSSDTLTHCVLYREFAVKGGAKIGGIVHTHSPYAVRMGTAAGLFRFRDHTRRPYPNGNSVYAIPFERSCRA